MKKKWRVSAADSNKKLLAFLRDKDQGAHSVKLLKRAIDYKRCLVNGKVQRISTSKLREGDLVEIDLSELKELKASRTFTCPILYEDDHLLVVNKPDGLVCEDARLNALLPQYQGKLLLIHRLDKETSGALMLAKSAQDKEAFIELFRAKSVTKIYEAIVDGKVEATDGKLQSYLTKKASIAGQSLWGSSRRGKKQELALTFWKRLKVGKSATLLRCQPITGRTHQLRVHLSEMGHPILGDFQYGKHFTCQLKPKRHLLHAYILQFIHPITEKEIEIKAPLPQDFIEFTKKLF